MPFAFHLADSYSNSRFVAINENDTVVLLHKSCDVFQPIFRTHLERLGITHLVIAGMTPNLCCESTGRHAMDST